jgi:hypothetical protein
VVDILKGHLASNQSADLKEALKAKPVISVITQIEILTWQPKQESVQKLLLDFISASVIIPLDEEIAQKTIDIRKRFPKNPKLPDAIIASTAIVNGFTLITSDKIGFTKIPELELVHPFSA